MTIIYISMMFYENYALLYFMSNYWKGNPHNSDCKWEYLVDGMIEVIGKAALTMIC